MDPFLIAMIAAMVMWPATGWMIFSNAKNGAPDGASKAKQRAPWVTGGIAAAALVVASQIAAAREWSLAAPIVVLAISVCFLIAMYILGRVAYKRRQQTA